MGKPHGNMWEYLEQLGVLEWGTDEDIKKAKSDYRKLYKYHWKRNRRKERPEATVSLSKEEERVITKAAQEHNLTRSAFLRTATLAYLAKKYIVPNRKQVARLEQLLSQCRSDIRYISEKSRQNQSIYKQLEQRIELLEQRISNLFRDPPLQADNQ